MCRANISRTIFQSDNFFFGQKTPQILADNQLLDKYIFLVCRSNVWRSIDFRPKDLAPFFIFTEKVRRSPFRQTASTIPIHCYCSSLHLNKLRSRDFCCCRYQTGQPKPVLHSNTLAYFATSSITKALAYFPFHECSMTNSPAYFIKPSRLFVKQFSLICQAINFVWKTL